MSDTQLWIKIHSDPVMVFYRNFSITGYFDGFLHYPFLQSCGQIYCPLAMEGGAQASNMTVSLAGKGIVGLFSNPPLRKKVEIFNGETLEFSGVITQIQLGMTCELSLEA